MDVSKTSVKDVELLVVPPRDFFRVRVDGPFGAPAQDYSKHKVLLLVVSVWPVTEEGSSHEGALYFLVSKASRQQLVDMLRFREAER